MHMTSPMILGMQSEVAAGVTARISIVPQMPGRLRYFSVGREAQPFFMVSDVLVGVQCLIPGPIVFDVGTDINIRLGDHNGAPLVMPGQDISVEATNLSDTSRLFTACFSQYAVSDDPPLYFALCRHYECERVKGMVEDCAIANPELHTVDRKVDLGIKLRNQLMVYQVRLSRAIPGSDEFIACQQQISQILIQLSTNNL